MKGRATTCAAVFVAACVGLSAPTPAATAATAETAANAATAHPALATRASAPAVALPTTEPGSPAITSLANGRPDVFTRSSAGDLLHQYRPPGGSWTRSLNLGGDLASQPAAVSSSAGRMDVFARGTDNALWHRWYVGGRWSGWETLGGQIGSAPTVAAWAPGRFDVFAASAGGVLLHKHFASGRWSGWERLGGLTLASSPAVESWAVDRLDVFAADTAGRMQHLYFARSTGWSRWENLGGTATSQPAAASAGEFRLDVFARGTNGGTVHRGYARGSGWTAWAPLGGPTTSGPGAVGIGDDVRLVSRATNGFVQETVRTSPGAGWAAWALVDPYLPFRGLGTWVDVFDYAALDPATAVPAMRARGVRTLYLSTARFNGTTDLFNATEAGQWLDLAHSNGIRVVGWYLPAYGDMDRDVRRTVAIARFVSPGGQRFDAVGVDIERLDEVTLAQFNSLLVTHLSRSRAQMDAAVGAIVPSPFATDPGNRWAGFPWASVGRNSDVVVPMALWSFRSNSDGTAYSPDQVYAWVFDQVQRARSLTGRRVHVEGGVDDPGTERTPVTADRVTRFVDAARAAGAIGGSHYDYATTPESLWPILARFG